MAIYGFVVGQGINAAKGVALRELIDRGIDAGQIEFVAPDLTPWAIAPDSIVNVTSPVNGWGSSNKARRLARLRARTITGEKKLVLLLEDLQGNQRLGLLAEFESPIGANAIADGSGAILPHSGGGWLNGAGFFRSSVLWVWDAVSGRVVRVGVHAPAVEPTGIPLERASTGNLILYSGFTSGLTGWGVSGAGVNGSAVVTQTATDTTPLFDPAAGIGMPYSLKMTAGNPHAGNLLVQIANPTASIPANSVVSLALDYISNNADPLCYYLFRNSDGFYWNGSAFAAGATYLALPNRSSHQARPFSPSPISIGGTATTVYFGFALPTGGAASRVSRPFHAQLEISRYNGTRLVNAGASTVPREEADLCFANETTRRAFPTSRGTAIFKGSPNWNTARADGKLFYFFSIPYDSNNEIGVYYDGVNSTKDRVVASRKSAGSTTTAAGSLTVVEDVPLFVAIRWASTTDGELDAYGAAPGGQSNFDVWAGSAGSVARIAGGTNTPPTESTDSRLQVGGRSGDCFDGLAGRFQVFPYVMTDQELLRWCI